MGILFMKDASIKLKTTAGSFTEYNAQVQSCEIEVSPGDEVDYPTLDGNVQRNVGAESYALVITAGQDWSATGLARFLFDNARQTLDFEYQAHGVGVPAAAGTPIVTGQVKAVPGNYGGEAGAFAEIEVSLPCLAKPVLDVTP